VNELYSETINWNAIPPSDSRPKQLSHPIFDVSMYRKGFAVQVRETDPIIIPIGSSLWSHEGFQFSFTVWNNIGARTSRTESLHPPGFILFTYSTDFY
jgi:hypothetical protein